MAKKKLWEKAEEFWRDLFRVKAYRVPGSGNQPGKKGDVRYVDTVRFYVDEPALLESKQTATQSLSIKRSWLAKITQEATCLGRVPLFGMIIDDEKWVAMPVWAINIGGTDHGLQHSENNDAGRNPTEQP